MPDVLLHMTRLHHDGFPIPNEAARVVVEAQQSDRGLQASRILSMDKTTEVRPAKPPPTFTAISGLERARVKWFNRLRGFGFLTRGEDSPEIFVHMETIRRFGLSDLRPGQVVLVRFGSGPKGLTAAEVRHESALLGPA
jgi:CspA family cold shock protein